MQLATLAVAKEVQDLQMTVATALPESANEAYMMAQQAVQDQLGDRASLYEVTMDEQFNIDIQQVDNAQDMKDLNGESASEDGIIVMDILDQVYKYLQDRVMLRLQGGDLNG